MFYSIHHFLIDTKIAEVMKKDPERDCRIYNVKARAREIFKTLDLDGNGFVDEDEFIEGKINVGVTSQDKNNFRLYVGRGLC